MTHEGDEPGDAEALLRLKALMVRQSSLAKQLAEITKDGFEVVQAHDDEITKLRKLAEIQATVISDLTHRVLVLEGKVK